MSEKVAIVMRKAPYGSVYTAEGFRTIMGIAVFEMNIDVVFLDDGVYALLKNQDPAKSVSMGNPSPRGFMSNFAG
ncbi:MAG: DsrE family protein, partial [Chloroflexota bacterium]|nr:DsrE family protein [Chloroflexota bacterium]